MDNPIPAPMRGWLYVTSVVVGGLSIAAMSILETLGMAEYSAIPGGIAAAVASVTGILARSNLTPDDPRG